MFKGEDCPLNGCDEACGRCMAAIGECLALEKLGESCSDEGCPFYGTPHGHNLASLVKDFDFKPARSIDYDEVQKPINHTHASIDAAGTVTIAAHYVYATGEDLDKAVWPLNRSVACLPVWGWEYSAKADIGGAYWYSVHPESDAHLRKRYALALASNWTR